MKHYEVNFVDQTVQTVMSDELPPSMTQPMYHITHKTPEQYEIKQVPESRYWYVTLLTLDSDNVKLVPFGKIYINLDNVTFIKEV